MSQPYDGSYEAGRLRRGALRAVKKLGPHQYRVAGNHSPHYDVNLELDTPCDCPDAQYHGRGCLHELAARLLGEQLLAAEKRLQAATARTTTRKEKAN